MEKHRSPVVKKQIASAKNTLSKKESELGTGTESVQRRTCTASGKVRRNMKPDLHNMRLRNRKQKQRFSLEEKDLQRFSR